MKNFLVIKGNLHTHTDEQGKHKSGYPVERVIKFFEEEEFGILGITDHKFSSSRKVYSILLKNKNIPFLVALGYEMDCKKTGFHVVKLFFSGIGPLKIYAHPFRSFGENGITKAKKFLNKKGFSAIELDNYVFFNSEIIKMYKSFLSRIPVISNSDFHNDLFMMKNSFTLYLSEDRNFSSIKKAIKDKNIICVYPDFKTWELQFLPQNDFAKRKLDEISKRKDFKINPYVRPENMDLNYFKNFYKTSSLTTLSFISPSFFYIGVISISTSQLLFPAGILLLNHIIKRILIAFMSSHK